MPRELEDELAELRAAVRAIRRRLAEAGEALPGGWPDDEGSGPVSVAP